MFIRHKGVWRPDTVPLGPVEVDWRHPLSVGLIGAWVPTQGYRNLTGMSGPLAPPSGAPPVPIRTMSKGPAWIQQTGNAGLYGTANPLFKLQEGTFFWRGQFLGAYVGTYNCIIAGVSYASTDISPYVSVSLGDNGGGVCAQYGGSGNSGLTTAPQGVLVNAATTFDSIFSAHYYIDGKYKGYTNTAKPTYSATSQITIAGYLGDLRRSPNVATYCALFYNRTDDAPSNSSPLVEWLDAEPFAMLRPRTVRRYYGLASATGAFGRPTIFIGV